MGMLNFSCPGISMLRVSCSTSREGMMRKVCEMDARAAKSQSGAEEGVGERKEAARACQPSWFSSTHQYIRSALASAAPHLLKQSISFVRSSHIIAYSAFHPLTQVTRGDEKSGMQRPFSPSDETWP